MPIPVTSDVSLEQFREGVGGGGGGGVRGGDGEDRKNKTAV